MLLALSAATGAGAALGAPVMAADVDMFLAGSAVSATGINPFGVPATYSLVNGTCLGEPLPSGGQAPSYVDLPSGQTGVCASFTGEGTVTGVCTTGEITGSWSFAEPGGDTATMAGQGVIVQGIAIMVAAQSSVVSGLGYFDPSTTSSPGTAVAVAAFTGDPTAVCGLDSNDLMTAVDAAVVASS